MDKLAESLKHQEFKVVYLTLPKYAKFRDLNRFQIEILEKYLGSDFLNIINGNE